MLDRAASAWLQPVFTRVARRLVRAGIGADAISVVGFVVGIGGAAAIVWQQPLLGLALLLASRIADALDGAVARLTRPTDRGAFLDITLDFLFYAAVPLAFALADPARNALAAAVLLAAFIGTGSSFLAFAALAAKRDMAAGDHPEKGLVYLGGLTEATETIVCFVLMCLAPQWFATLAYAFAALCGVTFVARLAAGWRRLGD